LGSLWRLRASGVCCVWFRLPPPDPLFALLPRELALGWVPLPAPLFALLPRELALGCWVPLEPDWFLFVAPLKFWLLLFFAFFVC